MFRHLAIVALLACPLASPAFADDPKGRITITGTASIQAAPDTAIVSAGVETVGKTAREALDANTAAMQRVFAAIKTLGIELRDVQTSNFNIGPDWQHGPEGARENGFRVSNQVSLRLRDIDRLGSALDALVEAGANRAGGVQFIVEDADERLDEARTAAVKKARERAELYAAAAGVKLGRIVSVQEGGGFTPPPGVFARAEAAMDTVPVARGEQELSASVTIVWQLKD